MAATASWTGAGCTGRADPTQTVLQAMHDPQRRAELDASWHEELLPVFAALGLRQPALDYLVELRERLLDPFVAHRLAEIAHNHEQKKQRRLAPLRALAAGHGPGLAQPRLRAAMSGPLPSAAPQAG